VLNAFGWSDLEAAFLYVCEAYAWDKNCENAWKELEVGWSNETDVNTKLNTSSGGQKKSSINIALENKSVETIVQKDMIGKTKKEVIGYEIGKTESINMFRRPDEDDVEPNNQKKPKMGTEPKEPVNQLIKLKSVFPKLTEENTTMNHAEDPNSVLFLKALKKLQDGNPQTNQPGKVLLFHVNCTDREKPKEKKDEERKVNEGLELGGKLITTAELYKQLKEEENKHKENEETRKKKEWEELDGLQKLLSWFGPDGTHQHVPLISSTSLPLTHVDAAKEHAAASAKIPEIVKAIYRQKQLDYVRETGREDLSKNNRMEERLERQLNKALSLNVKLHARESYEKAVGVGAKMNKNLWNNSGKCQVVFAVDENWTSGNDDVVGYGPRDIFFHNPMGNHEKNSAKIYHFATKLEKKLVETNVGKKEIIKKLVRNGNAPSGSGLLQNLDRIVSKEVVSENFEKTKTMNVEYDFRRKWSDQLEAVVPLVGGAGYTLSGAEWNAGVLPSVWHPKVAEFSEKMSGEGKIFAENFVEKTEEKIVDDKLSGKYLLTKSWCILVVW